MYLAASDRGMWFRVPPPTKDFSVLHSIEVGCGAH
jgi:hypothetical protein